MHTPLPSWVISRHYRTATAMAASPQSADILCPSSPAVLQARSADIPLPVLATPSCRARSCIIDSEDHAFREPVLVRAVPVRTPRHKRVPAVDLIAGRQLRREPPESNPRTCRARPHMGGNLHPPSCHPVDRKGRIIYRQRAATAEIGCLR